MYLHLGQDYIVPLKNVLCVFDFDTATISKRTQKFLNRMQEENKIIEIYEDIPRAGVLCEGMFGETLYLTELSSQAIERRMEKGIGLSVLFQFERK